MSLTLCHYYIVAKLTFTKNLMVNELKQEGMVASLLLKKMLYQHNGYYHLIFNKKFCLYQTFLDLQFCYYKKGSPIRFLINSGSCWRKPTAKIRCFASTVLGELNKEWLSLQNIVIKQFGNRTWQKEQARRNFCFKIFTCEWLT